MVSVLAFYSDDPSSNPADAYSFSVKFVYEKNENKRLKTSIAKIYAKISLQDRLVVSTKRLSSVVIWPETH